MCERVPSFGNEFLTRLFEIGSFRDSRLLGEKKVDLEIPNEVKNLSFPSFYVYGKKSNEDRIELVFLMLLGYD